MKVLLAQWDEEAAERRGISNRASGASGRRRPRPRREADVGGEEGVRKRAADVAPAAELVGPDELVSALA
jgi:hypothetical protein